MIRVSRGDWLGVWVGLEVNLFRVIPLLLGGGSSRECECCIKYFMMQAIGSILVLGGALVNMAYLGLFYVRDDLIGEMSSIVVSVGLIVKIGLVPFHF